MEKHLNQESLLEREAIISVDGKPLEFPRMRVLDFIDSRSIVTTVRGEPGDGWIVEFTNGELLEFIIIAELQYLIKIGAITL